MLNTQSNVSGAFDPHNYGPPSLSPAQGDVEMEGDTNDPPQQQTTTTTSSSDDAPEHSSKKRKREEPSTVSVPSSGTTEGDGDGSASIKIGNLLQFQFNSIGGRLKD